MGKSQTSIMYPLPKLAKPARVGAYHSKEKDQGRTCLFSGARGITQHQLPLLMSDMKRTLPVIDVKDDGNTIRHLVVITVSSESVKGNM